VDGTKAAEATETLTVKEQNSPVTPEAVNFKA
jgi:hypothetical protein